MTIESSIRIRISIWDYRRKEWRFHTLQGLEMGLAHAIKVALRLLFAAIDLAGTRLGAVPLTETLRLDYARASFRPTVATFVFQVLIVIVVVDLLLIHQQKGRFHRGRNDGCVSCSSSDLAGARRHGGWWSAKLF
jgi:hypothetical protein